MTVVAVDSEYRKREKVGGSAQDSDYDGETVVFDKAAAEDAVYGVADGTGTNFCNMGWIRASVVQAKAQIGLGVLGIPSVMASLGIVPAILILVLISGMSTSAMFIVGKFKIKHPAVHSIGDVGMMWWGPVGRELLGAMYLIYMVMISGSGLLSISISFNALSQHSLCTVVYVVIGTIIVTLLASIQTLEKVALLGWAGLVSIIAAILTLTVAVGLNGPTGVVPGTPLGVVNFGTPTFAEASSAIGTIVFAFGGTPAFFNTVAEMRNPRDYWKAAIVGQILATVLYLLVGSLVYIYAGIYVTSPALGTAGPLMKRICYGLALPALIASSTIYTHFSAKYIFVRILRGSGRSAHLSSNSFTHWAAWIGSVVIAAISAYLIADGIPVFDGLISLVGALFGASIGLVTMGGMWLTDNLPLRHNADKKNLFFRLNAAWAVFLIVGGAFIVVAGSYGAIAGIATTYAISPGQSFSCADNSAS